jgi:hypothetical protein
LQEIVLTTNAWLTQPQSTPAVNPTKLLYL